MLIVHFAPNSRAGRIIWLLEELGLPYEVNKMRFHPEDLKSETHRARHPLGRVPVLEDDGKLIWESGAIVEYILECHEKAGLKPDKRDPSFPAYLWALLKAFAQNDSKNILATMLFLWVEA